MANGFYFSRMFRILIISALLLFDISSRAAEPEYVSIHGGLFNTTVDGRLQKGGTDVIINANSSGTSMCINCGRLVQNRQTQANAETLRQELGAILSLIENKKPPKLPYLDVQVVAPNRTGFLVSSASMLDVKRLIYITARHVLTGVTLDDSDDSRKMRNGLTPFEVLDKTGAPLDIILLIANKTLKQANLVQLDRFSADKVLAQTLGQVLGGNIWSSWQVGSVDQAAARQVSGGIVSAVEEKGPHFWLAPGFLNFSSPGSSGSLVWASPSEVKPLNWQAAGIVECREHIHSAKNAVRVISLSAIASGTLIKSSFEKLSSEVFIKDPNCDPIGRRGGGGTDDGG